MKHLGGTLLGETWAPICTYNKSNQIIGITTKYDLH
jgi:hypothetical protein